MILTLPRSGIEVDVDEGTNMMQAIALLRDVDPELYEYETAPHRPTATSPAADMSTLEKAGALVGRQVERTVSGLQDIGSRMTGADRSVIEARERERERLDRPLMEASGFTEQALGALPTYGGAALAGGALAGPAGAVAAPLTLAATEYAPDMAGRLDRVYEEGLGAALGAGAGKAISGGARWLAKAPILKTAGDRMRDLTRLTSEWLGIKDFRPATLAARFREVGKMYDDALRGKDVPLDAELYDRFQGIASDLPRAERQRLQGAFNRGRMTGKEWQTFRRNSDRAAEKYEDVDRFLDQLKNRFIDTFPDLAPIDREYARIMTFKRGTSRQGPHVRPSVLLKNFETYSPDELYAENPLPIVQQLRTFMEKPGAFLERPVRFGGGATNYPTMTELALRTPELAPWGLKHLSRATGSMPVDRTFTAGGAALGSQFQPRLPPVRGGPMRDIALYMDRPELLP